MAEITGTAAIVHQLEQRGMALFLLTNMPTDVFEARVSRFDVLKGFQGAVVSGAEGVVKPDATIFRILVDRYGLDAAQALFIDDSPLNITAAQALGFQVHRFRTAPQLAAELAQLGLLPAKTVRPATGRS